MTICYECEHFLNLESGSARQHVWYNHVCTASPLSGKIDPVTGHVVPQTSGGSDSGFMYCRDVNDGNCAKFKRLPVSLPT